MNPICAGDRRFSISRYQFIHALAVLPIVFLKMLVDGIG
jgi:hypothetical protein